MATISSARFGSSAFMALALLFALGCGSDDAGPDNPESAWPSREKAAEELTSVVAEHPSQRIQALATKLTQELSSEELSYLENVDWEKQSPETVLNDAVLLRAIELAWPTETPPNASAQSVRVLAAVGASDSIDCEKVRAAIANALAVIRSKLKHSPPTSFTCAAIYYQPQVFAPACVAALAWLIGFEAATVGYLYYDLARCIPSRCSGSYAATCRGCLCGTVELTCAECGDGIGGWLETSLPLPCSQGISNCRGRLVCGGC
jgi:hypothetical protein